MKYIILAVLALVSLLHLFGRFAGKKIGAVTKPMLLLLMLAYYIVSADVVSVFVIVAIVMSWAGDVLLMPHGIKWFIAGGVGFMISHLFYMISYSLKIDFSNKIIFAVIPVAAVYYAVSYKVITRVRKGIPLPGLYVPSIMYLVFNSTMNIFALMLLLTKPSLITALIYIGALLFFTSDCILFLRNFHENRKLIPRADFLVMLTYIIGEFLIINGLSIII